MMPAIRLPYPGLRAFTRDESDLFFGRDGCVDSMVDRLAATRFLAVLGSSGSGKSSLVRTGLLDALDLGFHPWAGARWIVADSHPGGQPIRNLATALLASKDGGTPEPMAVDLLSAFLRRGPRSLVEWVNGGNLEPGCNLLVLVDQFEELFRYGNYARQEEAEAFVALLLESAVVPGVNLHIVITMRSEFLGACALMPGLAERINSGLNLTPRMTREECRDAILGPAGVTGFKVDPALVNRLLNDLASFAPWEAGDAADQAERLARRADQLPLMQHVLNRLWSRAREESGDAAVVLRLADYDGIGGLAGAIDAHGKEILTNLGAYDAYAEPVFRSLVSGNSVATAVRRPSRISELVEVTGNRAAVEAIVEAFRAADCNFLRTSEDSLASDTVIVDISHESLIRQWTPLRHWLENEARDASTWQRLLAAQSRYSRGEGGLLAGLDLHGLSAWWDAANPTPKWADRNGGAFTEIRSFLDASRKAEDARAEAEQQMQLRERRLLRFGIAALAAGLLLVSGLAILSNREMKSADRNAANFDAAKRAAEATSQKNVDLNSTLSSKNEVLRTNEKTIQAQTNQLRSALQTANAEKADADSAVTSLHSALDEMSDTVNSDSFQYRLGTGDLHIELMKEIRGHKDVMDAVHKGMVTPAERAHDEYHDAIFDELTGNTADELNSLKKGYEDSQIAMKAFPAGQDPPEATEADFLNDAYRYCWFLMEIGRTDEVKSILKTLREMIKQRKSKPTTAKLIVVYGRIENLEAQLAYLSNNTKDMAVHARLSRDYGDQAAKLPTPDLETQIFWVRAYLNLAGDGSEKDESGKLQESACTKAQELFEKAPNDERVILQQVECMENYAADMNYATHKGDRQKKYEEALQIDKRGLDLAPNDPGLLLDKAELENFLAGTTWAADDKTITRSYRLEAKSDFVKAIKGRIYFGQSPGKLRKIYDNCTNTTFDKPEEEAAFYKEILDAVTPTLKEFSKIPSLAYIGADASLHLGQALGKIPDKKPEAEAALSQSVDYFQNGSQIKNLSSYTEDIDDFCNAYLQQAQMYADDKKVDLVVDDANRMKDQCTAPLEKYPWDFYLRGWLINTQALAGKSLFDAHNYQKAVDYLSYASHWGMQDSTHSLAEMYRNGWGVGKDEKKAAELDQLAKKQTYQAYTLTIDFGGGDRSQVTFRIWQWPKDYPYDGIDDQVKWWKDVRGGTVPANLADVFREVEKIARDRDESFPELLDSFVKSYDVGWKLYGQKKWTEAVAAAQDALKIYPNSLDTHVVLARSLFEEQKWTESAAVAEDALKVHPDSADAYNILARALYQQKKFTETIAAADQALKIDPNSDDAYDILAQTYYQQLKWPEAQAAVESELKIDPNSADVYIYLARVLNQQQKWKEVLDAAEKALKIDPDSLDALNIAETIEHDRLFQFEPAYELGKRRADLGSQDGEYDFVEANLSVKRFDECARLAVLSRDTTPKSRINTIMSSFEFACLSAEKKTDAALTAGKRLRTEVAGLQKIGWTFTGTNHFISDSPEFAGKAPDWINLFDALENGDEKKALAALKALGVPE
jgi:tetratricopeptide (TPR) repeat protein